MMMFSGGEIGIEEVLPQLASLKRGEVWQHGKVSWWCDDNTPESVFGITRTLGASAVSLLANVGPEPISFSAADSLGGAKIALIVGQANVDNSQIGLGPDSAVVFTHQGL